MKEQKIITIITVILLVGIISVASFVGIYKKDEYKVANVVPDYTLGMEFTDSRVINLEVDKTAQTTIYDKDGNEVTEQEGVEYTEENGYRTVENKINPNDVLTAENYKKTKSIMKNRLKKLGVDQYKVVLDESTGNIQIRIPENDDTNLTIYNLLQTGTFELKDGETQEVLLDTNSVKSADVMYSQQETQTAVFIQIKFNNDAKQKLEEIINTYKKIEEATEETENNAEEKTLELYLNGQLVTEISPENSIMNNMLYIGVGAGTDSASLEQYRVVAQETATILNSGVLPIIYTETDNVEASKITTEQIRTGMYVALGFIALMVIVFVIGLKTKGILASILQIGYIALLLLTLRYTNVKITIEGICGIVLAILINFEFIYKAFKNTDKNFVKDITAKFALKLIPVYIIAIILSFNSLANIYSLGMTLVWGIIVMYLYNLTLTQITLKTINK